MGPALMRTGGDEADGDAGCCASEIAMPIRPVTVMTPTSARAGLGPQRGLPSPPSCGTAPD